MCPRKWRSQLISMNTNHSLGTFDTVGYDRDHLEHTTYGNIIQWFSIHREMLIQHLILQHQEDNKQQDTNDGLAIYAS